MIGHWPKDSVGYYPVITGRDLKSSSGSVLDLGLVKLRAKSQKLTPETQFFHAHEPRPSELPHDPQGPAAMGEGDAELPLAGTAKTDSLGSSFLLLHFGQAAFSLP